MKQKIPCRESLQTDQPFKRAIFPFGLRMVEAGLKAAGFEDDPRVREVFTKYRKTHNESVFDADTPEIINCRRSGISSTKPAHDTEATQIQRRQEHGLSNHQRDRAPTQVRELLKRCLDAKG